MSTNALLYFELSSMRLTAICSEGQDGPPLESATVELTMKDIRGNDIDTTGMAAPIVWPVTMVEGVPGRYEYVFAGDFPVTRGTHLRGATTVSKAASTRYAEAAIKVIVDKH